MSNFSPDGRQLRALMSELIAEVPDLSVGLVERSSGLRVRYPAPAGAHPLVGTRVPELSLVGGDRVFAALRTGGFVALDYTGHVGGRPGVAVHHVDPTTDRHGWTDVETVLVRPDGHAAWAGDAPALAAVAASVGIN